MAKKKKGWMQRETKLAAEAKKNPKKKRKLPGGRDVMGDFCPKCGKPKDKRRGVMCDYANPDRCQESDCPLKDPTAPKDAKDRMKIHVGNKIVYGPVSGPFQIANGKIKSLRRSAGIKKKNEAWLAAQEAKKNPKEVE